MYTHHGQGCYKLSADAQAREKGDDCGCVLDPRSRDWLRLLGYFRAGVI